MKAQRLVSKKLVDHAVDSKAHCNTAIWSLKSCITWGAGTATYPSTIPIVTSYVSKRSKLQAFKGIAYPMAQARVESFSTCGDAVRLYVLVGTNSQYRSCGNPIKVSPRAEVVCQYQTGTAYHCALLSAAFQSLAPSSGAEQLTGTGLNSGLVACKPKARLGCILNMRVGYIVLVVTGSTKLKWWSLEADRKCNRWSALEMPRSKYLTS